MTYISTKTWRDLTDGHLYREGEPFPFDGREIPGERLAELESGRNRAGLRLIRAAEAQVEQTDWPKAEAPVKAAEGRKKASASNAEKPAEKPKKSRTRKQ